MSNRINNDVLDYIEFDLDCTFENEPIVFEYDKCLEALEYVFKENDRRDIEDLVFYLVFTPYEDLLFRGYDFLIENYPNMGFELLYGIHYLDSNPAKSFDVGMDLLKNQVLAKEKKVSVLFLIKTVLDDNQDLRDKTIDLSLVGVRELEENAEYYVKLLLERDIENERNLQ